MKAGAVEAALAPAVGGSLAALRFAGTEILRTAPASSADPLQMASFPLVPYANRIAHGRFRFAGRDVRLPLNFGDHPHSIHGIGWTSAWHVEAVAQDSAHLTHRYDGDGGWPWAYEAQQHFTLFDDTIEMRLTLRNIGDEAMPAGLGFHPYFQADEDSSLQFQADRLWLAAADLLPVREVAADALGDWSAGAPVRGDGLIDNVYGGWNGSAIIRRGDGTRIELSASGASWFHVYRPPLSRDFCLEPVSHMPDAVNRPEGMESMEPGAEKTLSLRIAFTPADEALPQRDKIA
ncbi:aldose 1-epimerase [Sphingobium sp. TA15]|uniref:Putative epimerase n=1 Tax=Sphingobium indicum (strain DSM 16413 / CCM 7287 / MTCC 6362 / UT26 / NBRC 101211 / UT26S) TaxID=452662 RepID=D4Z0I6_SPHIU|nr:aldose 1-epimerase [Sphingobium indicum]BAI96118.1 putative epimerase [Sphingobium indicum UT26S]BDD65423.1 aldose 1-epimerase [Sphingobium sp. TA15]